jgi:8-oxo-dGTP pyrophosphatase MutT (NUDIX family)
MMNQLNALSSATGIEATKTAYVLMAVFDPTLHHMVCITKLKGPSFLLNKVTFPGGRIELGEDVNEAASRELFEEVGLTVAPDQWVTVDFLTRADAEMTTLAAVVPNLFSARQCEEEPVHIEPALLTPLVANPARYAPDFADKVAKALTALSRIKGQR